MLPYHWGNFPNLDSYSYKNTVKITNVGVSVMARYDMGKKRKLAQVVGGFCFYKSFNDVSNTDVAYSGNGPIDPVLISPNFKIDSNSINISVSAGLRALLPIGRRSHVSIGGNLEYFLIPDEYYFAPKKGNIFSIGATLGYLVNL